MKRLGSTVSFVIIPAVVIMSVAASELNAQSVDELASQNMKAKVDALFAEWNKPDSPGCAVGISQNGATLYQKGYGMASLEWGIPITPAAVFPAASISKQFTAMSILLLAQRGKLSLDDDVRKHIPEWTDHGSRITIRHLLTHTSGLRDVFMLQGLAPPKENGENPNDALLKILLRARGLNFPPGAQFQYNNGGYNLLGTIVKRISGQSLRAFAEVNIFKPLGMTHTHLHDEPGMIVPNRVTGYHRDEDGLHLASENGGIVGNAGMQTTVGDLLRWEQNFSDARVGDRELLTAMQTPAIPTGWSETSSYGFGLDIAKYRGLRTVGHGGGDRGISSYVVRYPDQGLAVAILCNLDNLPAARLTENIADVYLGGAFTAPAENAAAMKPADASLSGVQLSSTQLSSTQLSSKVGLYYDPVSSSVGRVFLRDGKLMASESTDEKEGVELSPVNETRFIVSGTPVVAEFVPAAQGRPQELRVTGAGPKPMVSHQVTASPALLNTQLRAFQGLYTSREVEGTYLVSVRDSRLVIQLPGRSDLTLEPILPDIFAGPVLGVVKFSRSSSGVVTGFKATSSGARDLWFGRAKR